MGYSDEVILKVIDQTRWLQSHKIYFAYQAVMEQQQYGS